MTAMPSENTALRGFLRRGLVTSTKPEGAAALRVPTRNPDPTPEHWPNCPVAADVKQRGGDVITSMGYRPLAIAPFGRASDLSQAATGFDLLPRPRWQSFFHRKQKDPARMTPRILLNDTAAASPVINSV